MERKEESGSGFVRRVSFCCFLFRIIYKDANEPRKIVKAMRFLELKVYTDFPYVGPLLSISLTAYDISGGFDNNLYSLERNKTHP